MPCLTQDLKDSNLFVINESEAKTIIKNSKQKLLMIFYADWCPYCVKNLTLVKNYFLKNKCDQVYFVDLTDPKEIVWLEDGESFFNMEVVPTYRIYHEQNIIDQHTNVIDELKLKELHKKLNP